MVSLTDARFSLPEPQVRTSQITAPADTTVASAIQAFGKFGGDARKGHLQGALLNDLQEAGDIINTINQGDEAIRGAIKEGAIDPTSKRFQSLAAATSQGKISQQRAAIEAEVLLRESIAKAPGFADDFRKTAREVLGFDPSSASLNTLFLSGPDAAKTQPLTQEQKDLQQAEAMFKGGAVDSVETGFRLIQQDRANQLRENIQAGAIADGRVNAGKIAVEGANRVADRLNGIMVGAMQQIEQTGGIADIEAFRGAVLSTRDQVVRKIENEMAASQTHVYSPEEYNQVRARVNEQADAYVALLDNQDLTSILSRNRARLADLVEIAGVQLAPDLAVLAPFGETVVRSYMDMMTISGGDPRKIAELMKADPTKAFVGNLVLDGASIAGSLKGIAEGNLGNLIETGEVDKDTAKAMLVDQANGIANGKPTGDIDMTKVIQGLSEVDMPQTAVSLVAKQPRRAFSEMDEPSRQVTVQNFTRTQDQQVNSLQRALAGGEYQLSHDGQEFVIVDVQGRALREIVPTAPITFANEAAERNYTNQALAREAGVSDALSYINKTLMPVTSDSRWAALMGHEDGNAWASDLINKVNLGALANDVGNADNPVLGGLGLREQGALRAAFRAGDVERAMEILGGAGGTGGLGAQVTGVSSGRDLTGVSQPILRDGATDPAGLPIQTQAPADTLGFEGFRPTVYSDPAGIRTIGYGHNLEANPLTAADKQALGLDPNIAEEDIVLTEQQAQDLYRRDVRKIIPGISSKVPNFSELPRGAQKAIVDMAFNMGVAGVAGFKDMIKALKDNDYDAAADAMLDSNYAKGWIRGKDGKVIKDEDGNPKVFKGLVDRARINAERMRGR